jgi:N-acetylneuraminic acid mutarotase
MLGILAVFNSVVIMNEECPSETLKWRRLPDIPAPFGVAGPFVGVHNHVLFVAGGANFPEGVPWRPAASGAVSFKRFHSEIYALTSVPSYPEGFHWSALRTRLPQPIGYGVSVSTDQGVLCVGGEWQEYSVQAGAESIETKLFRSDDVYLLKWDPTTNGAEITREWLQDGKSIPLPKLPKPTTAACGAIVNGCLYLAGGDSGEGGNNQFLRLNLSPGRTCGNWVWEILKPWNGPPRTHALAVEQAGKFFLISGRNKNAEEGLVIHTDAHCYDPETDDWERLADVQLEDEAPRSVMAGTIASLGDDHIVVFGGAEAEIILLREKVYPARIDEAKSRGDWEKAAKLQAESDALYDDHAGFSRDILVYSLVTNSWSRQGAMPVTSPVTTTAIKWEDMIVIPSGEERPGVRTQAVWGVEIDK